MIKDWDRVSTRNPKLLKKRIRKGVPDAVRGQVWNLIAGVDKTIEGNEGRYDRIVEMCEAYTPNQDIRDKNERDINR